MRRKHRQTAPALVLLGFLAAPGGLLAEEAARPSQEPAPQEAAFRAAARSLGSLGAPKELAEAASVLRAGFPASRPVLVEMARSPSRRQRAFALEILGEKGGEGDAAVVAAGLRDSHQRVRLAAVMALQKLNQRLGSDAATQHGIDTLVAYFRREPEPNNRKMAVKTLERWGAKAAIPHLAALLRHEKERSVRNFVVRALEVLSGQDFGHDVEAWERWVVDWLEEEQAREILQAQATQGSKR